MMIGPYFIERRPMLVDNVGLRFFSSLDCLFDDSLLMIDSPTLMFDDNTLLRSGRCGGWVAAVLRVGSAAPVFVHAHFSYILSVSVSSDDPEESFSGVRAATTGGAP